MKVTTVYIWMVGENAYIVENEATKECVIIDPGFESTKLIDEIEGLEVAPVAILLTHGHYDHIGGVDMLREKYNIPAHINEADAHMPGDAEHNLSPSLIIKPADYTFKDGDILNLGGMEFRVIHTPGHTEGSSCFLCEDALFTGDTIFRLSMGRTDLIGGDTDKMMCSLKKLVDTLKEDYKIYPGHNSATTFFFERDNNPYIAMAVR